MTKIAFQQNGELFNLVKKGEGTIHMELPSATYEVNFHPEKGFFLERVSDMAINNPTYGDDMEKFVNRVMRSFDANKDNLGTMLVGRKGSGKTRTLKMLSQKAKEMMMPTIVISQACLHPYFNEWIGQFDQPLMLAFDEFDKMYAPTKEEDGSPNPSTQNSILALLQGTVGGGKKLCVFTANSLEGISAYLRNRPSRIRYTKFHYGLSQEAIIDYAKKHLANPSNENISGLLTLSRMTVEFNFDMLQALVVEMNLFKENAYDAAELLITDIAGHSMDQYIVQVHKDGALLAKTTTMTSKLGTKDFRAAIQNPGEFTSVSDAILHLTAADFKDWGETLNDAIYQKGGFEFTFLLVSDRGTQPQRRQLFEEEPTERMVEYAAILNDFSEKQRAAREKLEKEEEELRENQQQDQTKSQIGRGALGLAQDLLAAHHVSPFTKHAGDPRVSSPASLIGAGDFSRPKAYEVKFTFTDHKVQPAIAFPGGNDVSPT